jgi:hypothetical protein
MIEEPPGPPPETPPAAVQAEPPVAAPYSPNADGAVVIDLTRLVPPPPAEECAGTPDPFQAEIVVCTAGANPPRLGPMVGPVDDGFGSAIPRARIKLSENAEAEANLIKQGVGGFDADGAEVRLKIGF